ncbi:aminodeoxychorismate lyase [Bifidobacterium biavatii]|uniref:Aminotransferase, class IV n=1 Tax=Bifidobacterium biavatii DSM 23969 TaxID=1437608 RepID=A0A087A0Z9_9BIFI|nr:aminodeoxychorismate lyase [Bifidobacterium biavatii]KFI52449.1 aminotransferase, class IV [Bifidobacterium biavatii DSM 23969]
MTGIVLGIGNSSLLFAPKGTAFDPSETIELVDPEAPHVSVFDLSVLRGDGIFEATTVWKGFPVSLENHLRRLVTSAAMTDLPEPNVDAFTAAVQKVIDAYDDPEPGPMLRILVSRGFDPTTGVGANKSHLPSVWIFLDGKGLLHELTPLTMISLSRGYASDVTAKAPWLLNGAKTLSYAISQSEHRLCGRRGIGDSIQYTTDGFTLECPNSSIVAQYGDTFVTPDPRIGILNGTSQREMFAWALQEGKKTEYKKLPLAELREADALFMTHGGWVIPVRELDGKAYEVDMPMVEAVNDAMHTGRTRELALTIGPSGDYEF